MHAKKILLRMSEIGYIDSVLQVPALTTYDTAALH